MQRAEASQPTSRWGYHCVALLAGIVAVAIGAYRLYDWRYFFVGDEYGFFSTAERIVQQHFRVNWFSSGVHVMNYTLVSVYQALFLAIHKSFWMWRFSNVVLFIPICYLVFVWGRLWFSHRTGAFAAIFVAASFFLHNYFLIAYPNPLALLFLCLLHTSWGAWSKRDTSRITHAVGLGLLLGVAYYVYLGPLLIASIAPYVVYKLFRLRRSPSVYVSLIISGLCYLGVMAPGVLLSDALPAMLRASISSPEFHDRSQILVNIANSFRLFFWNPRVSHFITGPYLDIFSAGCCALGAVVLLLQRNLGSVLLILSFILVAILVGATSPYAYPPITRGILFIPFGCLSAAIGFDWCTRYLPKPLRLTLSLALPVLLAALNTDRAEGYYRERRVVPDLYFMREVREQMQRCPTAGVIRVQIPDNYGLANGLDNLSFFISTQLTRPVTIILATNSPAQLIDPADLCDIQLSTPPTFGVAP